MLAGSRLAAHSAQMSQAAIPQLGFRLLIERPALGRNLISRLYSIETETAFTSRLIAGSVILSP